MALFLGFTLFFSYFLYHSSNIFSLIFIIFFIDVSRETIYNFYFSISLSLSTSYFSNLLIYLSMFLIVLIIFINVSRETSITSTSPCPIIINILFFESSYLFVNVSHCYSLYSLMFHVKHL